MADTVIIGAGPGGLGAAGELAQMGVHAVVLDRAPHLAATWQEAYDRVRLNTVRWLSHLPGERIPRAAGRWPARDDYLAYLERYARERELDVRLGVHVERVERDGDRWRLISSAGELTARDVIVATGYSAEPSVPAWEGRDSFGRELLHSHDYRNGARWRGRGALVVGAGNSGAEIAVDLLEHGAAPVRIAVRTPPHVVVREAAGVPNQVLSIPIRRLPAWAGDAVIAAGARMAVGDLTRHGLARPPTGAATAARRGAIPIVDSGFVDALRAGRLEVVAPVRRLVPGGAELADGTRVYADVLVAATGYGSGLEPLVGHLGVLDERGLPAVHGARTHPDAPSLRFLGFTNPISGNLRELRLDARRVARAVATEAGARRGRREASAAARCCAPGAAA